jgi:hypothetical protein
MNGCQFPQTKVDQTPRYDNQIRRGKRGRSSNQVMSRKGIIRPDKRKKPHFL